MYIIAEIAQSHDGSLGNALAFIESAANVGLNSVKFQLHIAEEESTHQDKFRIDIFPQDKSRFFYWKRTSFSVDQWVLITEVCKARQIDLIISPFSNKALDLCLRLDVYALKIGSGEFFNLPLVDKCIKSGKRTIISTGMSRWADIDQLFDKYSKYKENISLLHCVTKYPCPLEEVGFNNVQEIKSRYGVKCGLSDHSGDVDIGLLAASMQLDYYEAHICWSKMMFGPDVSSSLTVSDFQRLSNFNKKVAQVMQKVSKDKIAEELSDTRTLFSKSLVAASTLEPGTVLTIDEINYKKPGGGLGWQSLGQLLGKQVIRRVEKDQPFKMNDIL